MTAAIKVWMKDSCVALDWKSVDVEAKEPSLEWWVGGSSENQLDLKNITIELDFSKLKLIIVEWKQFNK